MKRSFILQICIILSASILFFSCNKEEVEKLETLKEPEVTMGKGKAASWFTINKNGVPEELGFEMTAEALNGLTMDPTNFAGSTFITPVDQKVKDLTAFDHLVINWNSHGHEPAGVFNVTHFYFHFYTITEAERMAIPPYMPTTAALHDQLPPAGFMPASFTPTPGGVPQMGKHWGDNNMQLPFAHTIVYGSFKGKVNCGAYGHQTLLKSGTKITVEYAQPTQFEKTGKYYPTKYNIYMDGSIHKHYVTLSEFVKR